MCVCVCVCVCVQVVTGHQSAILISRLYVTSHHAGMFDCAFGVLIISTPYYSLILPTQ